MKSLLFFAFVYLGCNDQNLNKEQDLEETIKTSPVTDDIHETVKTLVFPVYGFIPVGPKSVRLLWVPWSFIGDDQLIFEHRKPDEDWKSLSSVLQYEDSAVVSGLDSNDEVRITIVSPEGSPIAHSVAFEFTPATEYSGSQSFLGYNLIDFRDQNLEFEDGLVLGKENPPSVNDILILPLNGQTIGKSYQLVKHVTSDIEGWRAETEVFNTDDLPKPAGLASKTQMGKRESVTINYSLQGVPLKTLSRTQKGYVGYCSQSGWGCIQLEETEFKNLLNDSDLAFGSSGWNEVFNDSESWNYGQQSDPIYLVLSANVSVLFKAEWNWNSLIYYLKPIASVNADLHLNHANTDELEEPLGSPLQVPIYSAFGVNLSSQFRLSGVIDLDQLSSTPQATDVTGHWNANIQTSEVYSIGYSNSKVWGPYNDKYEPLNLTITPLFQDGSSADVWIGLRGSVELNLTGMLVPDATADLSATVGVVLNHSSTDGSKCNLPNTESSISQAKIDLGSKFEAGFEVPYFGISHTFPLGSSRETIISWGNRYDIIAPRDQNTSDSNILFRLKPGPLGQNSYGSVDVSNPSNLVAYLNGQLINSSTTQFSDGKYLLPLNNLNPSLGNNDFSVWLPEIDTPILRAHGQCVSKTIVFSSSH